MGTDSNPNRNSRSFKNIMGFMTLQLQPQMMYILKIQDAAVGMIMNLKMYLLIFTNENKSNNLIIQCLIYINWCKKNFGKWFNHGFHLLYRNFMGFVEVSLQAEVIIMEVVYLAITTRPNIAMKKCMDAFINGGWLLIKTESVKVVKGCSRNVLGWPKDKGKAILPEGFKNIKIMTI
jgi:hypothetical protein